MRTEGIVNIYRYSMSSTIQIHHTDDETICYHCNAVYQHKQRVIHQEQCWRESTTIDLIEIVSTCDSCTKLFNKKEWLEKELLNIEWLLFLTHYTENE